jgi:hypothetical protein
MNPLSQQTSVNPPTPPEKDDPFKTELIALLKKHGKERPSNTPHELLAEVMISSLNAFSEAIFQRDREWFNGDTPLEYFSKPSIQ